MKALLGTKIGMTQIISEDGKAVPVTLIKAGPVTVTQVKSVENDGYNAVQVGFEEGKNLSKAVAGHLKTADVTPKYIREFRVNDLPEDVAVGNTIDASIFAVGDLVDATGTSKVKASPETLSETISNVTVKTHGGKGNTRKPGSIGSMYPQKVFKGKRMAGHMGHEQVTVKNLVVAYVDVENNLLGLRGAVPGPKKGLIVIGGEK